MKKLLFFIAAGLASLTASAQADKSTRPSPPATVSETLASGQTISINYSQPSLKGRTIGQDIVPYGKVWRMGANEATTFEISKDAKIDGKTLPAGKYSLYSIPGEKEWTIMFNKTWSQWGTVYKETEDALRITAKPKKATGITEKLTYAVNNKGTVSLVWGETQVEFDVK